MMNMHDDLLRATIFRDRRARLEHAALWAGLLPAERRRLRRRARPRTDT